MAGVVSFLRCNRKSVELWACVERLTSTCRCGFRIHGWIEFGCVAQFGPYLRLQGKLV